jgi:signal transduction histidine kinase/ActR/RegA family two-component response regulator
VRALEGGADACLTEPIEPPVLIATVRALLRTRQAEDAMREALAREQAARAAADDANRAKDEFLATLSHELRSPLSAILTWATLLRTGELEPARASQAVEAIERNTRLQVKLINDLLDVSRIISGKMKLELAPLDVGAVLDATLESVRPAAAAKGLHLEAIKLPIAQPVLGDAARLQQVLWNLLSNAVKFTPEGGVVAVRMETTGTHLAVEVSDTGRGIDPAFLPHMFERFRQADSSTTRREGGLGLGLAIVRHLVELHGGTVEASSAGEGLGATFRVQLPLPGGVARGAAMGAAEPAANASDLRGVRVLLVDDDRDGREAVGLILSRHGAEVRSVASAAEALATLRTFRPSVIVSDIAMPEEDGFVLLRKVRALPAASGGTAPALALSALAGAGDRARILAAGFARCLSKPVDHPELVAAVAEAVDGAER